MPEVTVDGDEPILEVSNREVVRWIDVFGVGYQFVSEPNGNTLINAPFH